MQRIVVTKTLLGTDRATIRREVVGWWLEELPGTPHAVRQYRYMVERLADGNMVFLDRPAILNRGIDFQIKCEGFHLFKNGNCKPPSHRIVAREIEQILTARELGRDSDVLVAASLGAIWACQPYDQAIAFIAHLVSLRLERALKLARWLFIEQDLTYWTETGRWKLRSFFEETVGPFPDI